jgi:hypothetical protein
MMLELGDVIERPGPWPTKHRGIFAGWNDRGQQSVIHNPKGGCVKYDTLEVFANGQRVTRINQPARTALERNLILARAQSQLGKPYDILNFNCDHLVTYALAGVPSSPQLQLAVGVLALVGIGFALRS